MGNIAVRHYPVSGEVNAYALVVHGLNNKPTMMEPIIKELNRLGIYALNVRLTGHYSVNSEEIDEPSQINQFKSATLNIWQNDVLQGIEILKSLVKDKPTILVGYSLGAILGLSLIEQGAFRFHKSIFFAPALGLRKMHFILKLLPFKSMLIPSFMPVSLRANRHTPLSAYAVLFDLEKKLRDTVRNKPLDHPSLVIVDDKDEMISVRVIERIIRQQKLQNWQVIRIKSELSVHNFHHLITDRQFVGDKNWTGMWNEIGKFINANEK